MEQYQDMIDKLSSLDFVKSVELYDTVNNAVFVKGLLVKKMDKNELESLIEPLANVGNKMSEMSNFFYIQYKLPGGYALNLSLVKSR